MSAASGERERLIESFSAFPTYTDRSLAAVVMIGDRARIGHLETENAALRAALVIAQAALADIGDADREPGDDLAWCERRAMQALPEVRAALNHARSERVIKGDDDAV